MCWWDWVAYGFAAGLVVDHVMAQYVVHRYRKVISLQQETIELLRKETWKQHEELMRMMGGRP